MNKMIKHNKKCSLRINKYLKIGKRAKGIKSYIKDNKKFNYIEFEGIGLEFYVDERETYIRDLKCKNDAIGAGFSCFQDQQKGFFVMMGYHQNHNKDKR